MPAPFRIAWFSPLDASDSTSSYVSQTLLPHLSAHQIDVYGESGSPGTCTPDDSYDLFLYQLEDASCCEFIREQHHRRPGALWVHDFYRRPREKGASTFLPEIQAAHCVLFSNERDLREAKKASDVELPPCHFVPCPIEDSLREETNSAQLRIAYCGGPELEFRAPHLFAALRRLERSYTFFWLCGVDEKAEALKLCNEFEIPVELENSRSPQRWQQLVSNCDISFHGLFSAYGSPSPYVQISMMARAAVVVSDFSGAGDLPKDTVTKVGLGQNEIPELSNALLRLSDPAERRHQVDAGYRYASELHSVQGVVRDLRTTLGLEQSAAHR